MADKSLRTNALHVALRILGSEKSLSRRLRVPAAELAKWLLGEAVPTQVFLRTVDLLVELSSVNQLHDGELNATASNPKWSSAEGQRKKP